MFSSWTNSQRPSTGSLLGTWLANRSPHPDSFRCGVRVVAGEVAGEARRWRYRTSALDRLVLDDVITLNHGPDTVLCLRFDASPAPESHGLTPRSGYVIWSAEEQGSGARVLVTFPDGRIEPPEARPEA